MYDYSILPNRIVLCVDLRSFYASVSCIKMGLDPLHTKLAVVGDVNRSGSIVLAATPPLKALGVKKMVKWTPFAAMPEQFAGIREIIKDKTKVERPTLTQDEQERIENTLLCSLLSEEEILITYYEDGFLLTSYMNVIDIDPLNKSIICTDAFYNNMTLKFIDIIDAK
ncbi:YolD-like family protein [Bacillus cereus]|uniref:YolD-like family protein n=1 Tax=Bacillus cereus TaxID=1396 RepID=UPI0037095678